MKTGIIGLPQVGKTSLFKILTGADLSERTHANPREAHVGIATVPDERLDKLAALYDPRKLVHASVEYVDVAAMPAQRASESGPGAGLSESIVSHIRVVDSLVHVLRAFEDPAIPHVGEIDPVRDARNA
jgi:ribosome-binding ATPase YchF (GTP1/OBG family)